VVFALAGMLWGIHMAASHDHATAPGHAHLLLLGWVSMFLFGIFYRFFPDVRGWATLHWWLANIGVLIMIPGIALLVTGDERGEPLAVVGSLINVASMLVFAFIVFRHTRRV
jgi:cbb3-type cytochrome oxidase subunit 1